MKKTLIAASAAVSLVLSAQAGAQLLDVIDDVEVDTALALLGDANQGSFNDSDLSTDNSVADALNDNTLNTGLMDSLNDNDLSTDIEDSFWTNLEVEAVVTASALNGAVAGNAVGAGLLGEMTSSNTVDDYAFSNATGLIQFSQNGGHNALTQQNNTVQANLRID